MDIEDKNNGKLHQVVCPECDYRMPIYYDDESECKGVRVPCKGRHCSHFFEIKIENGKQIK